MHASLEAIAYLLSLFHNFFLLSAFREALIAQVCLTKQLKEQILSDKLLVQKQQQKKYIYCCETTSFTHQRSCGFHWQPDPCSQEQQLVHGEHPIPITEEAETRGA